MGSLRSSSEPLPATLTPVVRELPQKVGRAHDPATSGRRQLLEESDSKMPTFLPKNGQREASCRVGPKSCAEREPQSGWGSMGTSVPRMGRAAAARVPYPPVPTVASLPTPAPGRTGRGGSVCGSDNDLTEKGSRPHRELCISLRQALQLARQSLVRKAQDCSFKTTHSTCVKNITFSAV